MPAGIFNIAKGRIARYCDLPEVADEIVAVLIQAGGEGDSTLEDYDDLAALLAGSNSEASFTGYSQQTLTSVTVTVDDTNNDVKVDADDPVWSPTSAQSIGKILLCYDPTGLNVSSAMVPLFHDDFSLVTPTSGTVTYQIASGGFVTSS